MMNQYFPVQRFLQPTSNIQHPTSNIQYSTFNIRCSEPRKNRNLPLAALVVSRVRIKGTPSETAAGVRSLVANSLSRAERDRICFRKKH
jgi:hypothetical protein